MWKKLINSFFIFLSSGILLHRSTIIGFLCGVWVYIGANPNESVFERTLTADLYLFMAAFLLFYRLMFKKTTSKTGDFDWQAMAFGFAGDFLWAVSAMFCTVPFFMLFAFSDGMDYAERARAAVNPRSLMRHIPRP